MREEHDSPIGFGSRNILPVSRKPVEDSRSHRSEVSVKDPFGQVVLASLLTTAPLHSACFPSITFDFTLNVLSHMPKCGVIRRKDSHVMINAEM